MSVFLSKYFQGTKATIATISMVGSGLVLGWGIVASKAIYILGGSFGMLAPGFLLLDSSLITKKVRETFEQIKQNANRLRQNLDEMSGQNQILHRNNLDLQDSLTGLRKVVSRLERNELTLIETRESLKIQVEKLEKVLANSQANLADSQANLAKSQANLAENQAQLNELKNQIIKLRELHENAKKLLITLATAGDMFAGFSSSLSNRVDDLNQTQGNLDQTLSAMNNLLNRLTEKSFQKLDSNQDGSITEEEFRINLNKI